MDDASIAGPVLMTADAVGGVWTYALELCRGLELRGVKVALATMGRALTAQEKSAARKISGLELFESDYKLEWMQNAWDDVDSAGAWLLEIAAAVRPALIHLNGYCHGALPWPAPALIVGHSCVYSWFDAVRGAAPGVEWDRYQRAVAAGLAAAAAVTAPSGAMLAALKTHYGDFIARAPIYNGKDTPEFSPAAKKSLVLTAGRLWDEAKNVAVLGSVAGKISWPIYAAGESRGPEGAAAGLDGLIPLGRLEPQSLAGWYARAAIFVLPARYEPFGYTALEAALWGCALVLGDIPSLREIWSDAALFVDPDDPEEIAAALAKLIENPALRISLSERARLRALAFSSERMARRYLALYRELLSPRRGSAIPTSDGNAQAWS